MNLKQRWQAESPIFWKKVLKISIGITSIGTALALSPIALPTIIASSTGYIITAGLIGAGLAKITIE